MKINQRVEQKYLLIPELRKSLNILALPHLELKSYLEEELINNPFLEEVQNSSVAQDGKTKSSLPQDRPDRYSGLDDDFRFSLITKKISLQDILLRQLGIFSNSDEDLAIGQEIIGNIDENGYLQASLAEIANALNVTAEKVEKILKLIQRFEPAGVGARTVSECLLIQLELTNEDDATLRKIVEFHLEDLAKKKYKAIAKALKEPLDKIEILIKKISKLDPKPGRHYSSEEINLVIPDIVIDQKDEELEITINDEDIPIFHINRTYKDMLRKENLDSQAKEFLTEKLRNALELLRAISKRKHTLRKVIEVVIEVQYDAIKQGLSHLKPLTFQQVAQKLNIHESTVSRAIMNKYVQAPCGVVALKDFFPSHVHHLNGQPISSSHIKRLIRELIEQEDKKHPLSDQDISKTLTNDKQLNVSRRTVTKYREELKILSSTYRRER